METVCCPDVDLNNILDAKFNNEIASKILAIVGEVKEGGRGQWTHKQKFKRMVAEKYRTINTKFINKYQEFNHLRWLMFSNHDNALPLGNEDRRVQVVICNDQPQKDDYYSMLYGLDGDQSFISAVAVFLSQRDIRNFNPGARAALTEDKRKLIETARCTEEDIIEIIDEHWPYDIITLPALMGALTQDYSLTARFKSPADESKYYKRFISKFAKVGSAQPKLINNYGKEYRPKIAPRVVRNEQTYLDDDGKPKMTATQIC